MSFGLNYNNLKPTELYENFIQFSIVQYEKGKRCVLIIDEAQNLSADALEELRLLCNINTDKNYLLQLILVGQPQLRDTFKLKKLEQLRQRVSVSYHLNELNQHESCAYILHRIKVAGGKADLISELARKAIWYHSRGIPRVINTLCDSALVYAYAEKKEQVDIQLIHEVIKDRKVNGFYNDKNNSTNNVTRFTDNIKNVVNI